MHIRESENWTRLSALTFLLSTLEVYLRAVIRAALASDALLIPGFPKRVDGVVLLRLGRLRVPEDMISKCVKGTWNERVLAYSNTFGQPPDELSSSISGLEAMRKLRNQFAHESGRDALTSQRGAPAQAYAGLRAIDRIRLSDQRLKAFLGIVFSVASAVDGHLETSYVGDWEMLELFHLWKTNLRALEAALGSAANEAERRVDNGLIKMLARTTDIQIPGKAYFNGLAKYYSALLVAGGCARRESTSVYAGWDTPSQHPGSGDLACAMTGLESLPRSLRHGIFLGTKGTERMGWSEADNRCR